MYVVLRKDTDVTHYYILEDAAVHRALSEVVSLMTERTYMEGRNGNQKLWQVQVPDGLHVLGYKNIIVRETFTVGLHELDTGRRIDFCTVAAVVTAKDDEK